MSESVLKSVLCEAAASGASPKVVQPIRCQNIQEFEESFWMVRRALEVDGFALLEAWDSHEETLAEISSYLGDTQFHVRSGANGIVDVKPSAQTKPSIDQTQYIGTTAERFDPHTDGSYLHGMMFENGRVTRVSPPLILGLQCVQPAAQGGRNFLIDAQAVLIDLLERDPLHAEILLQPGGLSFCRDDQLAMDFALFEKNGRGGFKIRFRSDSMTYAQHWVLPSVMHLQKNYFRNPKYLHEIKLSKNQILLIDNTRMLHGRDEIPATAENLKRHLRRIWIAEENQTILMNLADESRVHRAFSSFSHYRRGLNSHRARRSKKLNLGIKLPDSLKVRASEWGVCL